jgi:hypothetical protein
MYSPKTLGSGGIQTDDLLSPGECDATEPCHRGATACLYLSLWNTS